MTSLEVAGVYVAVNMLLLIYLAFRVVSVRQSAKVSVGTGGNEMLELRTRVHGNATEYIPSMLVGLVILALMGLPAWAIHVVGGVFTLGRLMHVIGLGGTIMAMRAGGILLSWIAMVLTALAILYHAFA
ncbi:MAG TPA: glutathione S-transferase [Hyphomonas sp.]|nr:glutathione S-transferase [Hyphomonas sp.]